MMIYKPSKLIYSSVHIDRVHHFIRDHFSRIPLYTYRISVLTDPPVAVIQLEPLLSSRQWRDGLRGASAGGWDLARILEYQNEQYRS